jgi:hypothetical protein
MTQSDFLRDLLGKEPTLSPPEVNERWRAAGNANNISSAMVYLIRQEMGITRPRSGRKKKQESSPAPQEVLKLPREERQEILSNGAEAVAEVYTRKDDSPTVSVTRIDDIEDIELDLECLLERAIKLDADKLAEAIRRSRRIASSMIVSMEG